LEDLHRDDVKFSCLRGRRARRAHLKANVSVLLENPPCGLEDLVRVFFPQLLEVRDSWLEFLTDVRFVLAEAG
jgi:hypothetical protein